VYASSKRVTEWLAASAAARGAINCTAARFTHVVDNSIIHQRIIASRKSGIIRLHRPNGVFYAQSALESSQLLISAALSVRAGSLCVHAISDLGWPVDLLLLTLGALKRTDSTAALYFSGLDPGYQHNEPFPGLYDPHLSWNFSPLLNALEANCAHKTCGAKTDVFLREPVSSTMLEKQLLALQEICAITADPDVIRNQLDILSWLLFNETLRATPADVLLRVLQLGFSGRERLSATHLRLRSAIERHVINDTRSTAQTVYQTSKFR
jgi:hypothetical protein